MATSKLLSQGKERLGEGVKGVQKASMQVIALSLLLVAATAIGLSLPACKLDQRAIWALEGLSLLFSAIARARGALLLDLGHWAGLCCKAWEAPEQETLQALKEAQLKVKRSQCRRAFGWRCFFLMPFFQGSSTLATLLSMIAGAGFGLAISFGAHFVRKGKKWFNVAVTFIVALSSLMLGNGARFVALARELLTTPNRRHGALPLLHVCLC